MKTITLHYQPIQYTVVIIFSLILIIFFIHNFVGYTQFEEIKTEKTKESCKPIFNSIGEEMFDCKEIHYVETNLCTWSLLKNEKICSQSKYDRSKWQSGLILMIGINIIWYFALFYFLNESKHWINVKWVE